MSPRAWDRDTPDWPLLLLHMTLAGFAFLMLGTLLTGASNYLERYMHPFFLLTPLWLLAMVERSGRGEGKVLVLAAIFAAVTAVVVPVRAINLLKDRAPHCDECRAAIPYDGLAAALRARGVSTGTIIVADRVDGGNLRRFFPNARIVCLRFPTYAPPVRTQDISSPSAVVWPPAKRPGLPKGAQEELTQLGATVGASHEVRVPWTPFGAESAERRWPWMVAVAALSRIAKINRREIVSWLSARHLKWSKESCKWAALINAPRKRVQCKPNLPRLLDLVILH